MAKKISSLFLAFVMVLSLSVPAFPTCEDTEAYDGVKENAEISDSEKSVYGSPEEEKYVKHEDPTAETARPKPLPEITEKINIKPINNTVNYISAKLNTIYIIQWLLVGTATFVVMMADIDDLSTAPAILLGFAFVILSVLISKLYDKVSGYVRKKNF